jgi:hypothetical protein
MRTEDYYLIDDAELRDDFDAWDEVSEEVKKI